MLPFANKLNRYRLIIDLLWFLNPLNALAWINSMYASIYATNVWTYQCKGIDYMALLNSVVAASPNWQWYTLTHGMYLVNSIPTAWRYPLFCGTVLSRLHYCLSSLVKSHWRKWASLTKVGFKSVYPVAKRWNRKSDNISKLALIYISFV